MNSCSGACDADEGTPSVDAACVAQMRAVFWSMRRVIDASQADQRGGKALLYELRTLAEAGVALADHAIEDAAALEN